MVEKNNNTCKPPELELKVWNYHTLKDYFTLWIENLEKFLDERDRRIQEHFILNDSAKEIAAKVTETRLENLNEWKNTVKDRNETYFTRTEHEQYMKAVEADLRVLRESRAELAGAAKQSSVQIALAIAGIGMVMSACGVGISFIVLIMHILGVY